MKKLSFKRIILVTCIVIGLAISFTVGVTVAKKQTSSKVVTVTDKTYSILDGVIDTLVEDFYFGEESETYKKLLIEEAIKLVVDAQGDIHSYYMTAQEVAASTDSLAGSYVGIGVTAQNLNEGILVTKVSFDSPAEKAGVQVGDLIIKVDGRNISDYTFDENIAYIRGEEGTKVVITVLRNNEQIDIEITRATILNTISTEFDGTTAIMSISNFGENTAEELGSHLKRVAENKVTDLIIDLRDNGGGYVSTLLNMCGYFMDSDSVVIIENERNKSTNDYAIKQSKIYSFNHIVILINENSASAAEAFTLAMREHTNAQVVGVNSYGKNIGQKYRQFYDGSILRYTYMNWTSSKGVDIGENGITPDYYVTLDEALTQTITIVGEDESYEYDCVSNYISYAQKLLKFLGYDIDRIDGYCSLKTSEAIKKFQASNGLEATGKYDYDTSIALNQAVIAEYNNHIDIYDTQLIKAKELINE